MVQLLWIDAATTLQCSCSPHALVSQVQRQPQRTSRRAKSTCRLQEGRCHRRPMRSRCSWMAERNRSDWRRQRRRPRSALWNEMQCRRAVSAACFDGWMHRIDRILLERLPQRLLWLAIGIPRTQEGAALGEGGKLGGWSVRQRVTIGCEFAWCWLDRRSAVTLFGRCACGRLAAGWVAG